jgi:hypothetical protein
MSPEELLADAAGAIAHGTDMTLTLPKGKKRPPKFPRGELLCENFEGSRTYRFDPVRVVAWLVTQGLVVPVATPSVLPARPPAG